MHILVLYFASKMNSLPAPCTPSFSICGKTVSTQQQLIRFYHPRIALSQELSYSLGNPPKIPYNHRLFDTACPA